MNSLGILRTVDDSELELIRSWRNAPKVRANMYTRHEISRSEHVAWWGRIRDRQDLAYLMYEKDSTPLGIVGFTEIDQDSSNCSWAFYAAPEASKGTGSRMEFLALERVFGKMRFHKLYCEVLAFNTPVIKLHQKFGFQIEGTFRDHHRIDNTYVDIVRLGLLTHEWSSMRDELHSKLSRTLKET